MYRSLNTPWLSTGSLVHSRYRLISTQPLHSHDSIFLWTQWIANNEARQPLLDLESTFCHHEAIIKKCELLDYNTRQIYLYLLLQTLCSRDIECNASCGVLVLLSISWFQEEILPTKGRGWPSGPTEQFSATTWLFALVDSMRESLCFDFWCI